MTLKNHFKKYLFTYVCFIEAAIYFIFMLLDITKSNVDTTYLKYTGMIILFLFSFKNIRNWDIKHILIRLSFFFTLLADLFLLVLDQYYIIGVIFFLFTQIAYFLYLNLPHKNQLWISLVIYLFLLLISIPVVCCLFHDSSIALYLLVCFYFGLLLTNTIRAGMTFFQTKKGLLLWIGFILFVLCDLHVGLNNLEFTLNHPQFLYYVQFAMWMFYLPSQVLICHSCDQDPFILPQQTRDWLLSILFTISLSLFILTFSIGLPIYFRPFYYLQIKTLHMEESTGFTYQVIKQAYDEVLNFLTIGTPFGTGTLLYSPEGEAHFTDCKVLFDLNFYVLLFSSLILICLLILNYLKIIHLKSLGGFKPSFYASIVDIVIPVVVGSLASINFDKAFEIFHAIFFPGKTNWLFDPNTDQIILVMPEDFFMNCAILIGVSMLSICLVLIIIGIVSKIKKHKKNKQILSSH